MKFNKWTLGLAAVGAVSMASAVRADEAKLSQVQTALSNTTISGYVSASANWSASPSGGDTSIAGNIPLQSGKANGFNLDVVKVSIAKPQDESPWASGYQVDLLFGPDAVGWNPSANSTGGQNAGGTSSDFAIAQAFIALRTPVGNGIDWKIGVFNTIIGYESFDAGSNPNYTRSWGWAVEPTEHTGVLGSYKINDEWSFSAGVANTLAAGINTRNNYNASADNNQSAWNKTLMGSVTFSAPSNWGWASGSAFYAGMVYGFAGGTQGTGFVHGDQGGNQQNYYAGATLNSPWKDVTFGAAFDCVQNLAGTSIGGYHADDYIFGLYNTIKATDKLSFNTRGEFWEVDAKGGVSPKTGSDEGISLTETIEYDLWANVVSRLEVRYDKVIESDYASDIGYVLPTGVSVDNPSSYGVYANLIYKF
ncbi:MAG TPA: outer membrane beta-barrel protein [Verrucomicrobiae bacterium]